MVEHAAVNRGVVGSSPTRGATVNFKCTRDCHLKFTFFNFKNKFVNYISSLTLFIYLLHANPFLQYYYKYIIFGKIYKTFTYNNIVLWIVLWAAILFVLSTIAAIIFDKILRPIIQKISQMILWLLKKIYSKIEMIIFNLN